ncbi:hypothetical protein BpHYR1_038836 [Brachionus plicatilis]|uniref:Uncharacterized protein n=1 Tax=Brachionus plicatilis TaxID=10195 RepID=A0A3M7SAX1_BRAPC|nr:hypothetical protein BpHYR1_038836 [Brachionus plicatilis]
MNSEFMEVRKPFFRIFCSTSFSEKLARTFLTVKLNLKKSFCAERFEIVLNGYFFVLKRETPLEIIMPRFLSSCVSFK